MMSRVLALGMLFAAALFVTGCVGGASAVVDTPVAGDPLTNPDVSGGFTQDPVAGPVGTTPVVGSNDDVLVHTPEPASLILLGSSLVGLGAMRRRVRQKRH